MHPFRLVQQTLNFTCQMPLLPISKATAGKISEIILIATDFSVISWNFPAQFNTKQLHNGEPVWEIHDHWTFYISLWDWQKQITLQAGVDMPL